MYNIIDTSKMSAAEINQLSAGMSRYPDCERFCKMIKTQNPRTYNEMKLQFCVSEKFAYNPKTARMEYMTKITNLEVYANRKYFKVRALGKIYFLSRI